MNFTPRRKVGPFVSGILTIAVVGLIGWGNPITPAPVMATQNAFAAQGSSSTNELIPVLPAVETTPALQTDTSASYQTVAYYKHRHNWWRRNAPILGGAGGGALIGGLAGGGTGALIGGGLGAGGGALYKHYHHRHHYYH
jgi:hypothetical protein